MEIKKLVVNLSKDMHQELKTIAFFRNISMTDIIIEKVKEVIEEEREKGKNPLVKRQES